MAGNVPSGVMMCSRSSTRSVEWRGLSWCTGAMACGAADFRVIRPRQRHTSRSDFDPGALKQPPRCHNMCSCHPRPLCDHRRPCWQRRGRSCMGAPRALALGPGRSRQRATPRHAERAWPCALRCHHRSTHLHHRRAFRALGHSPCCRRRRRRSSAGSSSSPPASKRMCGPGASASAHLAPWKGHRRCTFPRRTPPRHLRSSWPSPPLTRALVPSSRRSKICSLSSI